MEKKSTKRKNLIENAETLVAVERERERGCLYRLDFFSFGTKSELFSTMCAEIRNHCVCHLVNNMNKKYNEYIVNKGRTMLFYNGIGLSLRVFERIKLARIRLEKTFNVGKCSKTKLSYNGAREGP